jgi:SAM-dependent methyltransferase
VINTFTGLHAGYYDLVYADKPYAAEARFVLGQLEEQLGRRPRTLLDIACGTGRHAAEFADAGIGVTGVDINEQLLEHARERRPDIEFVQQDMTTLELGDARFEAVTCLFDSIGYPQRNELVIATLEAARRHLADGGVLAVEFLNAAAMIMHSAPLRVRRWDTADGGELLRISETRLDLATQVMHVDYELVELRGDGTFEHTRERQSNRFFSAPEMGALMAAGGLELRAAVAAYEDTPEIGADTFHVLALARQAGPA